MAREQGWARATHAAISAGSPNYLTLFSDPQPLIRLQTAFLLAHCHEHRDLIVPALAADLTPDADPGRALLGITVIGVLLHSCPDPATEAVLETILEDEEADANLRLAAVVSLARIRGATGSESLLPRIRELYSKHSGWWSLLEWSALKPLQYVAEIFGEGSRIYRDLLLETAQGQSDTDRRNALYLITELCDRRRDVVEELARSCAAKPTTPSGSRRRRWVSLV